MSSLNYDSLSLGTCGHTLWVGEKGRGDKREQAVWKHRTHVAAHEVDIGSFLSCSGDILQVHCIAVRTMQHLKLRSLLHDAELQSKFLIFIFF